MLLLASSPLIAAGGFETVPATDSTIHLSSSSTGATTATVVTPGDELDTMLTRELVRAADQLAGTQVEMGEVERSVLYSRMREMYIR